MSSLQSGASDGQTSAPCCPSQSTGLYPSELPQCLPGSGQYPAGYHLAGPVTNQPTQPIATLPMSCCPNLSPPVFNCPAGLEDLLMLSNLTVHQKVEIQGVPAGRNIRSKFTVTNSLGNNIYYPLEDSDFLVVDWCCAPKPSDMVILDSNRREVIHLHRHITYAGCFPSRIQIMEVSTPSGTILAIVEWEYSGIGQTFTLKNTSGEKILLIESPTFPVLENIFKCIEFPIKTVSRSIEIGKITKKRITHFRSDFNFQISFPMDLDVSMKAAILGTCLLMDALFFENVQVV